MMTDRDTSLPDTKTRNTFEGVSLHVGAFLLFVVAAYFTFWFLLSDNGAPLWLTPTADGGHTLGGVFRALFGKWQFSGGEMDWRMLAWSIGAVGLFTLIGWFFLDSVEVYIPRGAWTALAFILGMGISGFVFEVLAMVQHLHRTGVFVGMFFLVVVLFPFAVWAGHRKTEAWSGGEGGPVEQTMRREMTRHWYSRSLVQPFGVAQWTFAVTLLVLISLITATTFYHALLFPETYWDSLILYLGYARMMYIEHGIVEKVVGQVGIGLGANYPHLYSLLGAAVSLAAREWSELPQRLIAPLCGVASTVLVYHTALRLTRHINFALCIALLYRAIPLVIVYDQYASDYALSLLFAAAFLYVALLYIETSLSGYFIIATTLIALSMHLNYLMGILWLPWALMIIWAHVGYPSADENADAEGLEEKLRAAYADPAVLGFENPEDTEPAWTRPLLRKRLITFLKSPTFYVTTLACIFVGSTWYIRNWIVTGNPVYAFFYEIFGGKHINPEVMKSAEVEWMRNGGGIGMFSDTLVGRIGAAWNYFVDWNLAYRIQPFFTGFAITGGLALLARGVASFFQRTPFSGLDPELARFKFVDPGLRFGLVALILAVALMAFHFVLAPFYLYQIILIAPVLAVLATFVYPYWRLRVWRQLFGALVIIVGLVPGLAMGLMGFKLMRPVQIGNGRGETQLDLFALRHPLPDTNLFYEWQFGPDASMWSYINGTLSGAKILTHENRHLVFDPTIELIHLDDWGMQYIWPLDPKEQVADLKKLGINYYLFVPNEENHTINERMGTDEWLKRGLIVLEKQTGETKLYRLK